DMHHKRNTSTSNTALSQEGLERLRLKILSQMSVAEKSFDPLDRTLTLVDAKDDLDPFSFEDGVLKARLPCGHVVSAESLTDSCRAQLDEVGLDFYVKTDLAIPLPYREVRRLADLTVEEMLYFEENIARLAAADYTDVQTCPKCRTNIERMDMSNLCVECSVCSADQEESYLFCWQCLKPWTGPAPRSDRCANSDCRNYELQLLQTCTLTDLPQVHGADAVPSIRACPTCGQRVEHDKTGCKNVLCPRCQIEFCFVCLKLTPVCLQTSSYFIPCSAGVAPRQTSIPVWRRT
uniref:RING-type domain-containing protein n=1 Tax=Neogobius melanostomus TaxID=47308 RepID=A0A8C6UCW7_9GOBI